MKVIFFTAKKTSACCDAFGRGELKKAVRPLASRSGGGSRRQRTSSMRAGGLRHELVAKTCAKFPGAGEEC